MNTKNECPRCGKTLPPDAPEGVCPVCLAQAYLRTESTNARQVEALPVATVAALFPDLEILELIGSGGMGTVYKARQPKLDRLVALKILSRDERDLSFVERFTREAQTLARLNHPNIVAVYEFGERDGLFFLIMELVDGVTLRHLLREGRMKPEQALAIVPPICDALQFAHEKGVIHRDIKPENILIDKDGRVKVADFGIARLTGFDREQHLTGDAEVVGTAHYMAPEQVERPTSVDHRADIYALGVVFYEMLTGELPLGRFPHPSKKVQVDVRLDEVVLKALEKEPEQRYQQASDVRTRVETIAEARANAVNKATETPGNRRRPWQLTVVASLFILFGLSAVWEMAQDWDWLFAANSKDRLYSLNLGILALPVGVGLLRFRPWWRVMGLIELGVVAILVLALILLIAIGQAGVMEKAFLGRELSAEEAFSVATFALVLALGLLGWMAFVLTRPSVKALFRARGFSRPWLEWSTLLGVAIIALGIVGLSSGADHETGPMGSVGQAEPGTMLASTKEEPERAFGTAFPNGVSFEVTAVCRNPRESSLWWKPDGTPLPAGTMEIVDGLDEGGWLRASLDRLGPFRIFPANDAEDKGGDHEVLVYVRRNYPLGWPDDLYGERFDWTPSPTSTGRRQFPNVRWRGAESGTASTELLTFDQMPDALDLRITIPMGPWEPVATYDGAETRELVNGVTAEFKLSPNPKKPTDVALEIIHNLDVFRHHDVRLMARLKDGSTRQVFIHSTSEHSDELFKTTVLLGGADGFRLSDVTEYELARTNLTSGEIQGIRLAPGNATEAVAESAQTEGAPSAADPTSIAGNWRAVSMHDSGREAPPNVLAQLGVWTISEDRIRFQFRDRIREWPYSIDPSTQPASIDIQETDTYTARGIYKTEGNTLTLCHPEGDVAERSTAFVSEPGRSPNDVLIVFERVDSTSGTEAGGE